MSFYSIAIDGPSGAGKSTLAKMIAAELNFLYVDTGAIYRTVGLYAKKNNVDPHDGPAVTALLDSIKIDMNYGEDGLQRMYLNGEDVTTDIRQHEISAYASAVSAIPEVRAFLLEMQRSFARTNNVVITCEPKINKHKVSISFLYHIWKSNISMNNIGML